MCVCVGVGVGVGVGVCVCVCVCIAQYKYTKSCAEDPILQNLIFRARLCGTSLLLIPYG